MITYKKLSENAEKFLAMTGYTVEEFQALPPFFQAEFEKWVGESRPDGKPRNRPKYPDGQKTCHSGIKKRHTPKNNIVSGEDCKVIFLTETCGGKKSDRKVADETGHILPEGGILYQDTGFQGFGPEGVIIPQPERKPKGGELTPERKDRNRGISRVRVRVEHVIGGVRRYRIVKDKLRNWKKGFRDKVMETCRGLHNFRLNFRPWKYAAI